MSEKAAPSHFVRNLFITLIAAAILAAAGYFYVEHQKNYPSTDDAYVHANIIYIAPQISGKVLSVNVSNYQSVNKGDLLYQIDPAPFQAQLDEARAAYEMAIQSNAASDDAILAASANVNSAVALLADAQSTYHRINELVNKQLLPAQQRDDAKAKLSNAEENVIAARAKMSQLIKAQGAQGTAAPEVKKAAAALSQATLSLSYTNIFAPVSGHLGSLSAHAGSIVSPGQALVPLVADHTYWVQANYKETQLERITTGMPATITLDLYPNAQYHGLVQSISPASGSSFSLLPPENATGNWVKVPQRFPLYIQLTDETAHPNFPLRVGASATVTIDTVSGPVTASTANSHSVQLSTKPSPQSSQQEQ